MSSITLNLNITSLNVQRRLRESTSALYLNYSRLSSGLRINRASDDAAGLAIATSLNVDARVFNQGVRNVNDAIGLLNVAEGALKELNSLSIRQLELASQSANGVLGVEQRRALQQESDQLTEEFNRIVSTVEFNGRKLLDASFGELRVQAGYGESGSVAFSLNDQFQRNIANLTNTTDQILSPGGNNGVTAYGDFDNDGDTDLVSGDSSGGQVFVFTNDGSGNFSNGVSIGVGSNISDIQAVDINGDSKLDLVLGDGSDRTISVMLGNGDGTFGPRDVYQAPGANVFRLELGDVDGDGALDVVFGRENATSFGVLLGEGDGSFGSVTYQEAGGGPQGIALGDVNNDGHLDAITSNIIDDTIGISLGNGDGTFANQTSLSTGGGSLPLGVALADFDRDGNLDIVNSFFSGLGRGEVRLGNGDGTFGTALTLNTLGNDITTLATDVTGDGYLDVAFGGGNGLTVYAGNGDGTFSLITSSAGTAVSSEIVDLSGDGAADLVNAFGGAIVVTISEPDQTSNAAFVNLLSQGDARVAVDAIKETIERINLELGSIGATQSRLATTANVLRVSRENLLAAASQIEDIDVASESARLVRGQILQQAGAALLAQANSSAEIARGLLDF